MHGPKRIAPSAFDPAKIPAYAILPRGIIHRPGQPSRLARHEFRKSVGPCELICRRGEWRWQHRTQLSHGQRQRHERIGSLLDHQAHSIF